MYEEYKARANPRQTEKVFSFAMKTMTYRYYFVRRLGGGGMGQVYLVRTKDYKNFALKEIRSLTHTECVLVIEAIEQIKRLNHPNIIPIFDVFWYESEKEGYTVYLTMMGLDQLIKTKQEPFHERVIWSFIQQMSSVLVLLHDRSKPIIHRDISPDNIMIDTSNQEKFQVVLIDFDLSREIDRTTNHTFCGKPMYHAPEISLGRYGTKVDIWSLGIVICEMALLNYPSMGEQSKSLREAMSSENETTVLEKLHTKLLNMESYSSELIETILSMLHFDSQKRITALQLAEISKKHDSHQIENAFVRVVVKPQEEIASVTPPSPPTTVVIPNATKRKETLTLGKICLFHLPPLVIAPLIPGLLPLFLTVVEEAMGYHESDWCTCFTLAIIIGCVLGWFPGVILAYMCYVWWLFHFWCGIRRKI